MIKKVLIVDDDYSIVDVVEIILKDAGFEVINTTQGSEAILLALKEKPDLILLDILMSGFDGREITKKLKRNGRTKNIPVIIMSANKFTKEIAKQIGADDFILKPFEMSDLLAKVRKIFS